MFRSNCLVVVNILLMGLSTSVVSPNVALAEDKQETMEKRLAKDHAVRRQKLMRDGRFEAGFSIGSTLGDSYRRSFPLTLHGNYFFTDQLGAGLTAFYALTSETSLAEEVRTLRPRRVAANSFSAVTMGIGLDVHYTPIHGKLSLLGISAIRYDLGLLGGVGFLQVDGAEQDGFTIAPDLGLNGRFFINDQLAISVFYKAYIYSRAEQAAIIDGRPSVETSWSAHNFGGLTVSYLLGKPSVGYE